MDYEKKNIQNIIRRNKEIDQILTQSYRDISKRFTTVKGRRFAKIMQKELLELRIQLKSNIQEGIKQHWDLGNQMGDQFTDNYLQNVKISDDLYKSFRTPNTPQLDAFLNRTDKGINLSKRVWDITNNAQNQIETFISSGITTGKSSIEISKDLNRFMKGKGIPYKGTLLKARNINWEAIRLASTETNMAFRFSEQAKMQKLPFVTGCTIHLSASHSIMDICDELQGDYPKNFSFGGWHPVCVCFRTWKKLPKGDFVHLMKTGKVVRKHFITRLPPQMNTFIRKNSKKLGGYVKRETSPYWINDNFTKDLKVRNNIGKI